MLTFNREIVLDDGTILIHSEQIELASKVIDMLISGEIEPIKTEKITSNSIQATKLIVPMGEV